ncbi:hypothetical protein AB0J38_41040 [Streptomyces sp. NPDC050095]|uniref:hypothetical protein n=1 Tax=unclassified Streptomyces TaxID=2593676 RepID=UPI0034249B4E
MVDDYRTVRVAYSGAITVLRDEWAEEFGVPDTARDVKDSVRERIEKLIQENLPHILGMD